MGVLEKNIQTLKQAYLKTDLFKSPLNFHPRIEPKESFKKLLREKEKILKEQEK